VHVVEQRRRDVDRGRFALPFGGVAASDCGTMSTSFARRHRQLALGERVGTELDREREAVELRFRQWICADLLDGFCVAMTKNGSGSGRVWPSRTPGAPPSLRAAHFASWGARLIVG
jgi:hypothetical protein